MSFKDFIQRIKTIKKEPTSFFGARILSAVQQADTFTHHLFFPSVSGVYLTTNHAAHQASLQKFAVKYACYALSHNSNFGFNATVNGPNSIVTDFFNDEGNPLGRDLLMDWALQDSVIGPHLLDPKHAEHYALEMAPIDEEKKFDFLTPFLVDIDGDYLPAIALLTFLKALDHGGANFKRVLSVWSTHAKWPNLAGFDSYNWLHNTAVTFQYLQGNFNTVFNAVKSACAVESDGHYGEAVYIWLVLPYGPLSVGLRTNVDPKNSVPSHGHCMVAGTPILLANGTTKPVESIQEGDELMAADGSLSIVSSERVVIPGLNAIYSFNDDEPFMTYEHAVMTHRGWASLDPAVTMELVPHESVSLLEVGDIVVRGVYSKCGNLSHEHVEVKRIRKRFFIGKSGVIPTGQEENKDEEYVMEDPPMGFDLHIRTGENHFFAHNYVSLLTYPEVTMQFVASNVLTNMSPSEQRVFTTKVRELSPLLSKALGATATNAFNLMLAEPRLAAVGGRSTKPSGKRRHRAGHLVTRDLVAPSLRVIVSSALPAELPHLNNIAVAHGNVIINGKPAATHSDGHRHLAWHRKLESGEDEHGVIRLMPHGLAGHGAVSYGEAASPVLFDLLGEVDYEVTYQPDPTTTKSKPFYDLDMGFEKEGDGQLHPVGKLLDHEAKTGSSGIQTYSTVTFSVNSDGAHLTADIEIDPTYASMTDGWVAAEITFTLDYRRFTGTLYKYDPDRPGYRGAGFQLRGVPRNLEQVSSMFKSIQANALEADPKTVALRATGNHPRAPTALLSTSMNLTASVATTVTDLYSLPPPDQALVHETAFNKMKALMLYALSQNGDDGKKWLSWFGETAPAVGPHEVLSQSDVDLLQNGDAKNFLVNRFAIGYLTQSFTQSTDSKITDALKDVPHLNDRLSFFWKGNGKTSFATDKGYSAITSALQASAYKELVPGLEPYLEGDAADWAKKLFQYCTTEPTLTGLALQNSMDGRQHLTHITSILHALDPLVRVDVTVGSKTEKVSYATALFQAVVDLRLKQVFKFVKFSNKEDFVTFLTEFFKSYFTSFLDGNSQWSDKIRAKGKADLDEIMKEFQTDDINATAEKMGDIFADFVSVITLENGVIAARLQKWAKKYPNLSERLPALGRFFTVGIYAFGLVNTIKGFMEWGVLKPQERAQLIINAVELAVNIFNDIAAWGAAKLVAEASATPAEVMTEMAVIGDRVAEVELGNVADNIAVDVLQDGDGVGAAILRAGKAVANAMKSAIVGDEVEVAAARWSKIAEITGKMAKGMNLVALGAATVVSAMQVANDFSTDQSAALKAVDIMTTIADGVAFLAVGAEIGAAILGLELMSAIPVIGEFAAVAGIILAVASLFIHRKPPPTPQEVFVKEHSVPFGNGLVEPPSSWTQTQKKVEESAKKKAQTAHGG